MIILDVCLRSGQLVVGVLVVPGRLGWHAERLLGVETIADSGEVAHGTGQVAFQDIGIQVLSFAAAHGFDEIAVVSVIVLAVELLDNLAIAAESDSALVVGTNEDAFAAVEDVADVIVGAGANLGRIRALARQSANLKDQLCVTVVKHADLRIGRLSIIYITEAAANADHRPRQLVLGKSPAGLIHLVDALVAEVAVAVVPEPVPIVMEFLPHERLNRRRTTPQVIIDGLGDR